MVDFGDTINGKKRGIKDKKKYTWVACERCGKGRWVHLNRNGEVRNKHCRQCAMILNGNLERAEKHPLWKGGKVKTSDGYYAVRVPNGNLFFPMCGHIDRYSGYVLEHRLVMAQSLGRCLRSEEVVHHKDGNKCNNEQNNLLLTIRSKHGKTYRDAYLDGYKQGCEDTRSKDNQN